MTSWNLIPLVTMTSETNTSSSSGQKRKTPEDGLTSRHESDMAKPVDPVECFVCGTSLANLTEEERQIHVNGCLGQSSSVPSLQPLFGSFSVFLTGQTRTKFEMTGCPTRGSTNRDMTRQY